MRRKKLSVPAAGICSLLLLSPVLISSTSSNKMYNAIHSGPIDKKPANLRTVPSKNTRQILAEKAYLIYDSMNLNRVGLSKQAFELAYRGYYSLKKRGRVNSSMLMICDFSQSSRRRRMYVIDVKKMELVLQTFVAHGKNSGGEYARYFSNNPESHKSSLGFYITGQSYYGEHGLALKMKGIERGINCKADARNIVIHGSEYVGSDYLENHQINGRSYGCPAVPSELTETIINTIKNGSCVFIYYPSKHYLAKSTILNG
ncbi:MAG TPA: murein L,D-transpeptidase catalytic domain family protein [Flavitalea sp.]|nr:murein L,D-transpeptidase catalytic domain family protein [Flavitalea sp.]